METRTPQSRAVRRQERPSRLAWDIRDIQAATGMSRNWCYSAMASGLWGRVIRAGRRILVRRDAVEAWLRGEVLPE